MKSGKARGQNRFVRIITLPIRALGRARDLYVKGMNTVERRGIASGMGGPAGQYPGLPKSFSARPSRSGQSEKDDYAELVRAASARTYGAGIDFDTIIRQQLKVAEAAAAAAAASLRKCGSVGMGKIDEDGPCDFAAARPSSMYPRSRSYAVAKRSVVF